MPLHNVTLQTMETIEIAPEEDKTKIPPQTEKLMYSKDMDECARRYWRNERQNKIQTIIWLVFLLLGLITLITLFALGIKRATQYFPANIAEHNEDT